MLSNILMIALKCFLTTNELYTDYLLACKFVLSLEKFDYKLSFKHFKKYEEPRLKVFLLNGKFKYYWIKESFLMHKLYFEITVSTMPISFQQKLGIEWGYVLKNNSKWLKVGSPLQLRNLQLNQ